MWFFPDWFIQLIVYAAGAFVVWIAVSRKLLGELLALLALVFAIIIPYQIDERDREQQGVKACMDTVLEFRQTLSEMYILPVDSFGVIQAKSAATDSTSERPSEARIAAQNAKDSTYILCRNYSFLDSNEPPWSVSPSSTSANWTQTNVADLYAWTAQALDKAQGIKATPVVIPGTDIPLFIWNN